MQQSNQSLEDIKGALRGELFTIKFNDH